MSTIASKEYREIIERLIKARKDAGLTQVEVAKLLGKPQSFVSKVESRERRLDIVEIKQFAKIYAVNVSDLI
ncbi:MAG: helix-turn-helix transcriptional regulator [Patescibacteria group bacterium]